MPKKTPRNFRDHILNWNDCTRCELCKKRNIVVLGRGVIPSEIVFIGEAPGESEDSDGRPFVGVAGRLLDAIIKVSIPEDISISFTNIVACIPKYDTDDDSGKKKTEPLEEHISACRPRLEEFLQLAKPKAIVTVGDIATRHVYMKRELKGTSQVYVWDSIIHPAAILRKNEDDQDYLKQNCKNQLQEVVRKVRAGPKIFTEPNDNDITSFYTDDDIPF